MKTVVLKFYMFQCQFFLDIAFLYQFTLHTNIYLNEPVKCVPCVVKTCSSAIVLCVLTCLMCLRAHVPTFLACLRVKVFCMLLLAHVPSCSEFLALYDLRDHMINYQHTLPPQSAVLMLLFSVPLPLSLKLYTLSVRFKSLINAFPL